LPLSRSRSTKFSGLTCGSGRHTQRAAPSRHSQSDGGSVGDAAVKASASPSGENARSVTTPFGRPVTAGRSLSVGPMRSTA
jgi:hypothetical protein